MIQASFAVRSACDSSNIMAIWQLFKNFLQFFHPLCWLEIQVCLLGDSEVFLKHHKQQRLHSVTSFFSFERRTCTADSARMKCA